MPTFYTSSIKVQHVWYILVCTSIYDEEKPGHRVYHHTLCLWPPVSATSSESKKHILLQIGTDHVRFSTITGEDDRLPWHLYISHQKKVFKRPEGGIWAKPKGSDQLMDTSRLLAGLYKMHSPQHLLLSLVITLLSSWFIIILGFGFRVIY